MSEDSVAQDQIVSFVDRILRLKEEVAAINADIREVYAEARGNGFDKTQLGKLVTYVAKRNDGASELLEAEAIFDLYLTAYDAAKGRATSPHVHARARGRKEITENSSGPATLKAKTAQEKITEPQPAAHQAAQSRAEANLGSNTSPDRREGDDDGQPHPVANVEEEANGAIAAASDDPASREVDDADRQQVAASGFSGDGEAGSPDLPTNQPETAAPGAAPETDAATRGEGSQATLSATYSNSVSFQPPSNADRGESIGSAPALSEAPATGKPGPVSAGPALAPGQVRYEACPPHGMVRHDFQRCFPERWGPQVADLADDIRENGIKRPIIMLGDQLLDGWSRYLIAREAGIEYPIKEYEGTDPLLDVIRWNIESRKLTMNERKIIASKLMKLPAAAGRHDEIALLFGLETEGQAG